ncbi:MAG: hypothetical protein QM786_09020 [Breznakibacter sp.]
MQIYTYLNTIKASFFVNSILFLIPTTSFFAQTKSQPTSPWEQQMQLFQKARDDSERTARIKALSDQVVAELERNGTILMDDSSIIHSLASPDKKIEVHYYVADIKENARQMELFVTFLHNGKRMVVNTSEELKPYVPHKNHPQKPPLKAELRQVVVKNDTLYQLAVKEGNHVPLDPIVDLKAKALFEKMVASADNDEKLAINDEITKRLSVLWNDPTTFDDPLKCFNRLSVLISPDKKVKIFTWNTQLTDASHLFWGALCVRQNENEVSVHPLIDKTDDIRLPERASLTPKKWYGAIYYDIVENTFNKQKFYTLIGFKGNTEFTKIKVIDVMTVTGNNDVKFNSAIVGKGTGYVPRAVFEYSLQANMMLKYDPNHQMIVMDNLTPASPQYKDIYMYYGPDFSYNGLKFEKGKWVLYPDIDLRNPKTK